MILLAQNTSANYLLKYLINIERKQNQKNKNQPQI